MFLRTISGFLLIMTVMNSSAEGLVNSQDYRLDFGVDFQEHLATSTRFDGVQLAISKGVFTSWHIKGKWRYLTEGFKQNNFIFQQQKIGVGYKPECFNYKLCWSVSFGLIRELLKQSSKQFSATQSDIGGSFTLSTHYQYSKHVFAITATYKKLFDINRYYLKPSYQYKLSKNWYLATNLSLGYNKKFEHDINEYQLLFSYQF